MAGRADLAGHVGGAGEDDGSARGRWCARPAAADCGRLSVVRQEGVWAAQDVKHLWGRDMRGRGRSRRGRGMRGRGRRGRGRIRRGMRGRGRRGRGRGLRESGPPKM